jgi:hypothetical protein
MMNVLPLAAGQDLKPLRVVVGTTNTPIKHTHPRHIHTNHTTQSDTHLPVTSHQSPVTTPTTSQHPMMNVFHLTAGQDLKPLRRATTSCGTVNVAILRAAGVCW